jgi:RNA polymerase sigma-70 factor (ECF subfamily)
VSEKELINACRNGDKDAQKELYIQYAEKVYALCIRYLGDKEIALDYTHDAIIKALLSLSRFKYSGDGSFYVWLRKITINMIIDNYRQSKRIKQVSISSIPEPADNYEDNLLPTVPPEILLRMISSMTEERRIVFNMYCIDGYSHKEIARRLGITEKGSASILAKARALLKKKVFDYVDE